MFKIANRLRRPVPLRGASTTASCQFRFAGLRSVESGALRVEIKSMSRVRFAHERTRISRHPVVFLYCHPGHRSRHPGLRPGISSSEQNQILSQAQNDGLRCSRPGRRRPSLRSSDLSPLTSGLRSSLSRSQEHTPRQQEHAATPLPEGN